MFYLSDAFSCSLSNLVGVYYFTVRCIYYNLFICPTICRHLSSFQFGDAMNSIAMTILSMPFGDMYIHVGYIRKSRMFWSWSRHMLSFNGSTR